MEPVIREMPEIVLAGFSFFGDPFQFSGDWTEENQIGQLWQRFLRYLSDHPQIIPLPPSSWMVEMHILHPDTPKTGEYEVFVGVPLPNPLPLPVELSLKYLAPATYAVFTLRGHEIDGDWQRLIFSEWMNDSAYESAANFSFQCYDDRFLGMDRIAESVLDVYIPVLKRTPTNCG